MSELERNEVLELEILKEIEKSPLQNNRALAAKLGCNLRLTHSLLSKLIDHELLQVKKLHARRWDYYLTPKGIAAKAQKTYKFFEFSMKFYQEARARSSTVCENLARSNKKRVAFIGCGNLAEIVYVSVKEWNLELTKVYGDGKQQFLGSDVLPYEQATSHDTDAAIVCVYNLRNTVLKNGQLEKIPRLKWIFEDRFEPEN